MPTNQKKDLLNLKLGQVTHQPGYLFLILLIFLVLIGVANHIQAETDLVGAIKGQTLGQDGQPLANIQVVAVEQLASFSYQSVYWSWSYWLTIYSSILPPWTSEELTNLRYQFTDLCSTSYNPYYPSQPPVIYRTISREDGSFLLENLAEGTYNLWAYDPGQGGLCPSVLGVYISETEAEETGYPPSLVFLPVRIKPGQTAGPFNLTLEPGGLLSGQVTDAVNGLPISMAKIKAMPLADDTNYGQEVSYQILTDQNGFFTFFGLPVGQYLLDIQPLGNEGYIPWGLPKTEVISGSENIFTISPNQTTLAGNLALTPGGEIYGRITNQVDGSPISCRQVEAFLITESGMDCYGYDYGYYTYGYGYYGYYGNYISPNLAYSDENGNYRILGLGTGDYICLVHGDAQFQGLYYPNTTDQNLVQIVHLQAGEQIGPLDFQASPLTSGRIIRGQILDADSGLPIAGISVNLNQIYRSFEETDYSITDPGSAFPPLNYPPYYLFSAKDGSFEFWGLESGTYYLSFNDPQGYYPPSYYPEQTFNYYGALEEYLDLFDNQVLENIQVNLHSGACLNGQVLDGTTPLAGILITPQRVLLSDDPSSLTQTGLSAITDTAGEFSICGLESGDYLILAKEDLMGRGFAPTYFLDLEAGGVEPKIYTLSTGSTLTNLSITMDRGATLSGQILTEAGTPLPGMIVKAEWITSADEENSETGFEESWCYLGFHGKQATTGLDGTYSLTGLPVGIYTLRSKDPQGKYQSACYANLIISSSSTVLAPDLKLSQAASLAGRVTSADGQPLAEILVIAYRQDFPNSYPSEEDEDPTNHQCYEYENSYYDGLTAEDGSYTIKGLPSGTYSLRAEDQEKEEYLPASYNFSTPSGSLTLAEGEEITSLDFCLKKGGQIEGTISNQTGLPLSDLQVRAEWKGPLIAVPTDSTPPSGWDGISCLDSSALPESLFLSCPSAIILETQDPAGIPISNPEITYFLNEAKAWFEGNDVTVPATNDAPVIFPFGSTTVTFTVVDNAGCTHSCTSSIEVIPEKTVFYSDLSDKQGHYTLRGLPAGTYLLSVFPEQDFQPQYFSGVCNSLEATLLAIELDQVVVNKDFHLWPGLILQGRVRDALTGNYITTGCSVALSDLPGTLPEGDYIRAGSYTNSLGDFIFTNLGPGIYQAEVDYCWGYHTGFYSQETDPEVPSPITIPLANPEEGIEIFLSPKSSIKGQVVDTITKEPLGRVLVTACQIYDSYSSESALTDAEGHFIIKNLEQGVYRVMAVDTFQLYGGRYYGNVPLAQWEQATTIDLGRSEAKTGIDIELLAGEAIGDLSANPDYNNLPSWIREPGKIYWWPGGYVAEPSYGGLPNYNFFGPSPNMEGIQDNEPPVINCQDNITVEAEGQDGVPQDNDLIQNFLRGASAIDEIDGQVMVFNDLPTGFPLGPTEILLQAIDSAQNLGQKTVTVTVADTTPPVPDEANLPEARGECSVEVSTIPTATDLLAGQVMGTTKDPLIYTKPGEYTITWRFDDGYNNSSEQTQAVIVEDSIAPEVVEAGPDQKVIEDEEVTLQAKASDSCNSELSFTWLEDGQVLSHEPILTCTFTIGTHYIVLEVEDLGGNKKQDEVLVRVDSKTDGSLRYPLFTQPLFPTFLSRSTLPGLFSFNHSAWPSFLTQPLLTTTQFDQLMWSPVFNLIRKDYSYLNLYEQPWFDFQQLYLNNSLNLSLNHSWWDYQRSFRDFEVWKLYSLTTFPYPY